MCYKYNGLKVSGEIKNGSLNGLGCIIEDNGARYEGNFVDSRREGYGKMWADNVKYEGMWHNQEYHGKGILDNGEMIYEGDFVNGKTSGYGKYVTRCGITYEG